jgi:hypothetical protein
VAPDLAESAAALDPKGWRWKSAVRIEKTGVQRLELSAAAVAGARSDGGDLRLLRDCLLNEPFNSLRIYPAFKMSNLKLNQCNAT